jgi:hypothetical protein
VQLMDSVLRCASLVVVVPQHGAAEYTWERKTSTNWEILKIPTDTCILYVRSSGMYRCQVSSGIHLFEVKGK